MNRLYMSVVMALATFLLGNALGYSQLVHTRLSETSHHVDVTSGYSVSSNNVRQVSYACGRFRPCRATDIRRTLVDDTAGPEDEKLSYSEDLDTSFRLEMNRRQTVEMASDTSASNDYNINEGLMEEQLHKQREEQASLDRAMRADLEAKYTRIMDERLKIQASEKDSEINKILVIKEQRETEISRLKFQLNESKSAMEESSNRVKEAENRIRSLKQEYAAKSEADKSLLDRITDQFSKEKDDLSDRVKYLNDELNDSKLERDQLKSLLASEETKFKETFENLQQAKIEYETSLTRLELELEESRKRQKNISTVTGYEKKELRKVAWDLESKLEAAKYELLIAKKDYLSLKNEAMVLQAKLTELQVSTDETIAELEEQLQADRMFYARSKQTSKNRIENLVQKFVRRIERRRRKADDVLKQSISEWQQTVEKTREALEKEKLQLLNEKDELIARNDFEARSKISALQLDMDNTVLELSKRIAEVRAEGRMALNNLRMEHEKDVADVITKNEREKEALIRELEAEKDQIVLQLRENLENEKIEMKRESERQTIKSMETLRTQLDREKYDLRLDYTQQVMRERNLRICLEDQMQETQVKLIEYERERSSLRNLLLLSWRLSKQRCLKLIRRR